MSRPALAASVWRHSVLGPLFFGLVALPLVVAGRVGRLADIRCDHLDSARTPTGRGTRLPRGTLPATLLVLPIALVSFGLAVVAVITVWSGELYPLRPEVIGHLDDMFRP